VADFTATDRPKVRNGDPINVDSSANVKTPSTPAARRVSDDIYDKTGASGHAHGSALTMWPTATAPLAVLRRRRRTFAHDVDQDVRGP
jgi:hypothetical protein